MRAAMRRGASARSSRGRHQSRSPTGGVHLLGLPMHKTTLPLQRYLAVLHHKYQRLDDGQVATYIPELAKADPRWFGICIVTADGYAYAVGDSDRQFTIQSMSKPIVYAAALADRGRDNVLRKVGVEPSGEAFNSISLDPQTGAPPNPMINAGAIATTGLVAGGTTARPQAGLGAGGAAFVVALQHHGGAAC